MRSRRSPRPLSLALDQAERRWAPTSALAVLQSVWVKAVGESLAAQATPTAHRAGVLTVSCAGAVWAQELSLSSAVIIARLAELAPQVPLVRLRCVCDGEQRVNRRDEGFDLNRYRSLS